MRNEAVLPIAQFLARAWSDKPDLAVRMDARWTTPEAHESRDWRDRVVCRTIDIPPPSRYPATNLISAYRLWRFSLWHEAMHHHYGMPKPEVHGILRDLFNIVEDYRVEALGVREYPGMKRERELRCAVYYELARVPSSPVEAYAQLLLLGAVKGFRPEQVPRVVEAARFTKEMVARGRDSLLIAMEVCRILGVNPDLPHLPPEAIVDFPVRPDERMSQRKVERAVERWVEERRKWKEKGKPQGEEEEGKPEGGFEEESEGVSEAEEILEVPEEVEEEVEQIRAENERIERGRRGAASEVGGRICLPSKLDVDESPYYDQELINHLVAQLRRVKRGWREVHSTSGELDVDSYVSRQPKAFIDEEQVKVGGFKVMLLLDHSGSIYYYEAEYKRACIALCECLEELGIPFAAYAFSAPDGRHTNVYLVKSFQERWTRMNAKRLAQIPPRGGTPLDEVYEVLKPQVERNKGSLYFITLTDGMPQLLHATRIRVRSLRRHCRMIGVAVGRNMDEAVALAENLGSLGYERYVALDNVRRLPEKILGLLGR